MLNSTKKAYKVRGFDFEMQFLLNDQQRKFLKRNKSIKHKRKVEGRGTGKGRGLLGSRVRFPAGAFAIFFPFLPKLHFQFPFLFPLPFDLWPSTFRLCLRLTLGIYPNEQEFEQRKQVKLLDDFWVRAYRFNFALGCRLWARSMLTVDILAFSRSNGLASSGGPCIDKEKKNCKTNRAKMKLLWFYKFSVR